MNTTSRRRGPVLVTVVSVFAFLLSLITAPSASAAGAQIENKQRGWMAGPACLEIDHARYWSGADATVDWCSNNGNNMQWTVLPVADGSGFVRLRVTHSGQCLDVRNGAYTDGAQIVQMPCSTSSSQQWKFVYTSWANGQYFYEVVARHSGKCLDKSGWNVVQWNCHGADWQQWSRPS